MKIIQILQPQFNTPITKKYNYMTVNPFVSFKSQNNDEFVSQLNKRIQNLLEKAELYVPEYVQDSKKEAVLTAQANFVKANKIMFQNMLNFEHISPQTQQFVQDWIELLLKREKNYNAETSYSRIQAECQKALALPLNDENPVFHFFNKAMVNFGLAKCSESEMKKIVAKYSRMFYEEQGEILFIRKYKKDFMEFLAKTKAPSLHKGEEEYVPQKANVVQPQNPPKMPSELQTEFQPKILVNHRNDIQNPNPLMLKYEELKEIFNKYRRENLDEKRIATATKMTEIRKIAQEKNISLVPKKELPITATLDERLKYLEDDVYPVMDTSIASTFDGYEMFEKYGFNTSDLTLGYPNSTFSDFSLHAITADVTELGDDFLPKVTATDEVVSRYLDLFNKFAKKEYGDEETLEYILDRTNKIMSEETALKYIATLKRYIPTQKYIVNPEFIFLDRTFGRFKDSEKIKAAIEDLKEYSKDLPKS